MLFNSIHFLLFFPAVISIYFLISEKYKYIWLLVSSYFFYMCWNVKYAALLFFSTFVTYMSGYFLQKIKSSAIGEKQKRLKMNLCVAGSFFLNLSILFLFKYFYFALENINRVFSQLHMTVLTPSFDIILPVGISFYTFQALSYTMDVYRGDVDAEQNFLKYALFVSFFPQLVAGPIERSKNLLKQIHEPHKFHYVQFCDGVYLMIWGYFLKLVLADRIAIVVDTVYDDHTQYGGMYLIVATVLFAFQIYCDFAGYSTIAMGAAKIMGFHLMENFNAPYFSQSVSEFWRRWHISLSSWFKDYLYFPLGGNRSGKRRKYLNLMIVFSVSGLWHGASWTFVIWGMLNAIFQILGNELKGARQKFADFFSLQTASYSAKLAKALFTFVLIDFTWIFFRAKSIRQAFEIIKSMLNVHNPWILFDNSLFSLGIGQKGFRVMMWGLFILLAADLCKYKNIRVREVIQAQDFWFRCIVIVVSVWFIIAVGVWGPGYREAGFIYFQF